MLPAMLIDNSTMFWIVMNPKGSSGVAVKTATENSIRTDACADVLNIHLASSFSSSSSSSQPVFSEPDFTVIVPIIFDCCCAVKITEIVKLPFVLAWTM